MAKTRMSKKFDKCVKSVRKTVKARKGSNKESAAIAICTTSVLHPRGRTLKSYRKGRLMTQKRRKVRGGGPIHDNAKAILNTIFVAVNEQNVPEFDPDTSSANQYDIDISIPVVSRENDAAIDLIISKLDQIKSSRSATSRAAQAFELAKGAVGTLAARFSKKGGAVTQGLTEMLKKLKTGTATLSGDANSIDDYMERLREVDRKIDETRGDAPTGV